MRSWTSLAPVLLLAAAVAASAQDAAPGPWRTRFFHVNERYSDFFAVENDRLSVDFVVRTAWTVSTIKYQGNLVGQHSGGTGAVFGWERDDPTLTVADIPDWPKFCARLKELSASETPNLGQKLWAALPEAQRAQVERTAAKTKDAEIDREAVVALLNRTCADKAVFEEPFLKIVTVRSDPIYARRTFDELRKLRADPAATPPALFRLNRKLLEYTFPGSIATLQQTIGTVHGGELVRSVRLEVDGKPCVFVKDGKLQEEAKATYSGKALTLVKESVIGPLDHTATFRFRDGVEGYEAVHRFTSNAEMARGHFASYAYTFMHMMPLSFCDFMVDRGDGTTWEGRAEVKEEKDRMLINEPWKTLIAYSQEMKCGVVYNFPARTAAPNHVNVRGGKDKKWRAEPPRRDRWQPGESMELTLHVIPFAATPEEWKARGKAIAAADVFKP